MKILEIIPSLSSGGAERFVVDLCNKFAEIGHNVILITLFKLDSVVGMDFYLSELSSNVKLVEIGKSFGFDLSLFKKIKEIIDKESPDVVHTHLRALQYILYSVYTKGANYKYFHTIHNDAKEEAADFFNRKIREVLFKSNKVMPITISDESDRSFELFYGVNVNRNLIYNGSVKISVNIENANEIQKMRKSGHRCIVNVARLQPQKNQVELVCAMSEHPDTDLFLIGNCDSDYAREVKKRKPQNVHILGQKKNPRDYVAAADAFILPSIFEGMPISLIECFSVGAIPIVTSVGGVKNMIRDGENGIVCSGTSASDISKAISRFKMLSESELNAISLQSKKSFECYDMDSCANKYLELFG